MIFFVNNTPIPGILSMHIVRRGSESCLVVRLQEEQDFPKIPFTVDVVDRSSRSTLSCCRLIERNLKRRMYTISFGDIENA